MVGEIGGSDEEAAAEFVRKMSANRWLLTAGVAAPLGKRDNMPGVSWRRKVLWPPQNRVFEAAGITTVHSTGDGRRDRSAAQMPREGFESAAVSPLCDGSTESIPAMSDGNTSRNVAAAIEARDRAWRIWSCSRTAVPATRSEDLLFHSA